MRAHLPGVCWMLWTSIELFDWQFNCLHFNCSTDCKNAHTLTEPRHTKERKSASAFHSRLCHGLLLLPYTIYTYCQRSVSWYLCQDIQTSAFMLAHLQIDSQINHWKLVALFVLWCVCVYSRLCRSFIPSVFVITVAIIIVLAKCLPESKPLTMQIVVTNNVKTR